MITLAALIALIGVLGFFTYQNQSAVEIILGDFVLSGIPLYVLVVSAFFLGMISTWSLRKIRTFSDARNESIRKIRKKFVYLKKKVETLERENTELKTRGGDERNLRNAENLSIESEPLSSTSLFYKA